MKRTHAERLARALAELDKPCKDEPAWLELRLYELARKQLRRSLTLWGTRAP